MANPAAFISRMQYVVSAPLIPNPTTDDTEKIAGFRSASHADIKQAIRDVEKQVEKVAAAIIQHCKANHCQFQDPDFGPTQEDQFGAKALYGDPPVPPGSAGGSKYPSPESLRWDRPQYATDELASQHDTESNEGSEAAGDDGDFDDYYDFDDDATVSDDGGGNVWCTQGQLFVDGSSSGDVIQGSLGDCWFLGALSVLATQENLLQKVFWKADKFKEYGFFVLRFFKDTSVCFVFIDDRIPCHDNRSGQPAFARCRDSNELWVPLIEKAYAKLHGSYKALIGGYVHNAIADLTGFPPELLVLKKGHAGFNEALGEQALWSRLREYTQWKSLMGCSIQPDPGAERKVEGNAALGLRMMHAYGLLNCLEIQDPQLNNGQTVKLVKLKNPWGFGEWTGEWSDRWIDEHKSAELIKQLLSGAEVHETEQTDFVESDGIFYMRFDDWRRYFSHLFIGVQFPQTESESWLQSTVQFDWVANVGGHRSQKTWMSNPRLSFRLRSNSQRKLSATSNLPETARVYIGVRIEDPRLTHGVDYYKTPLYQTPLSFDIISRNKQVNLDIPALLTADHRQRESVNNAHPISRPAPISSDQVTQPPYYFGAMQVQLQLQVDEEYVILPSLYKRDQEGRAFFTFASPHPFEIDGRAYQGLEMTSVKLNRSDAELSLQQCNERYEALRSKLVAEARKRNIKLETVKEAFASADSTLRRHNLKRRLQSLGFSLAEFPDDQFDLLFHMLDADGSGDVSISEFVTFFEIGTELDREIKHPEPPVDDIMFRPSDLNGALRVTVKGARALRSASTWFMNANDDIQAGNADRARVLHFEADPTVIQREQQYLDLKVLGPRGYHPTGADADEPRAPVEQSHEMDDNMSGLRSVDQDDVRSHFGGPRAFSDTNKIKQLHQQTALKHAQTLHKDKAFREMEKKRTKMFLNAKEQFLSAMMPSLDAQARPAFKRKVMWHKHRHRANLPRRDSTDVADWLSPPISQDEQAAEHSCGLVDEILEQCWVIINGRAKPDMSRFTIENNSPMILAGHMSAALPGAQSRAVTPRTPLKLTKGRTLTAKPKQRTPLSRRGGGTTTLQASQALLSQVVSRLETIREDEVAKQRKPQLMFVRLVKVPYQHESEQSTARPASTVELWFRFFDRDGNGVITFQEFKQTMLELRLRLTDEEYMTIFNRFQSRVFDGVIDWQEFLSYYQASKMIVRRPQKTKPIYHALVSLQQSWGAIQAALERQRVNQGLPALPEDEGHSLNCILFSSLSVQAVPQNVKTLHALCPALDISGSEFQRISVIFREDVDALMDFVRKSVGGQPFDVNVEEACDAIVQAIRHAIVNRASTATDADVNQSSVSRSVSAIRNMWESFASDCSSTMSFDHFASRLEQLLLEHIIGSGEQDPTAAVAGDNDLTNTDAEILKVEELHSKVETSNGAVELTVHKVTSKEGGVSEFLVEWYIAGLPVWVVARILADRIQSEQWGLQVATPSGGNSISYPAFEAFIRPNHVSTVEQKLRLLFAQQAEAASGSIYHMVRIYLSPDKHRLLLEAQEPVSGSTYNLEWTGDFSKLRSIPDVVAPGGVVDLIEVLEDAYSGSGTKYSFMQPTYDHLHYPTETYALVDLINRLRLVHNGGKTQLCLGEDRKFLEQLRHRCTSVGLPFFYYIDELQLLFQTSSKHLAEAGSLEKAVFGEIRARPQLATFLCSSVASLSVALSVYDGHDTISMSWPEMMAFVAGYKAPLVSLELLPPKIDATAGAIAQYLADEENGGGSEELGGVQRSKVDVDGGSHPMWNADFKFNFEPSALTLQSVLITDIHKLEIDSKMKYVVVMVRVGVDQSLYLTLYDPKSATDYICTGYDFEQLNACSSNVSNMEYEVANWLKENKAKLKLGEPITPRLVLRVYNKRGQQEELLGHAELSISTFLKNTGQVNDTTINLTYGEQFDAGQLFLRVSFETLHESQGSSEHKRHVKRKSSRRGPLPAVKGGGSKATGTDTPREDTTLALKLVEVKRQLSTLEAENNRLLHLVKSAELASQKLDDEKRALEGRCKELERKSRPAEGTLEATEAKVYEQKIQELEQTIVTLREQRDAAQRSKLDDGESNQENRSARDEELDQLREAKAEAEAGVQRLTNELRDANAQIARLQKQLGDADLQNVTHHSSSNGEASDLHAVKKRIIDAAVRELGSGASLQRSSNALEKLTSAIHALPTSEDGTVPVEEIWDMFTQMLHIELSDEEAKCLLSALTISETDGVLVVEPAEFAHVLLVDGAGAGTDDRLARAREFTPQRPSNPNTRSTRKAWVQSSSGDLKTAEEPLEERGAVSPSRKSVDWSTVPLPKGWERRVTDEGREYYLDHHNRATQWYHPSDPRAHRVKRKKKKHTS